MKTGFKSVSNKHPNIYPEIMKKLPFCNCLGNNIILASASPRRENFLRQLGLDFKIIPADIDETPFLDEGGENFASRMAASKVETIGKLYPDQVVIGADTIIYFQGEIIGKPENQEHALIMLKKMQADSHLVITGLSLFCQQTQLCQTITETSTVKFANFNDDILKAYISSGEPMDKSGAYAIQGIGSFLIKEIKGSCSNVIGLPMHRLVTLLLEHKIIEHNALRAERI